MKNHATVSVYVLDKEHKISCPPQEQEALLKSAEYLNKKMQEVRSNGKVLGVESIAVIAALNIAHELLSQAEKTKSYCSQDDIENLLSKIEISLES